MKMMTSLAKKQFMEAGPMPMIMPNKLLGGPIPPHERKSLISIEFDESDWELFKVVFEDEDEAYAAMQVILKAPPEIQIIMAQLIELVGYPKKEVA